MRQFFRDGNHWLSAAIGLSVLRDVSILASLTRLRAIDIQFGDVDRQTQTADAWISRMEIRCAGASQPAGELSGGNQQKIAIARLLHHDVDVLVLDEPTRGIDVGSKAQIYQLIGQLAAGGKAVLFVSSYLPELLGVCDTIGVMCRGVLAETRPASQWTEHEIINIAVGEREVK